MVRKNLGFSKEFVERIELSAKKNKRNFGQEIEWLAEQTLDRLGIKAPIEKEVPTPTTQEVTFGVSDAVESEGVSDWLNDIQNSLV